MAGLHTGTWVTKGTPEPQSQLLENKTITNSNIYNKKGI
jgi:hypothetical protein